MRGWEKCRQCPSFLYFKSDIFILSFIKDIANVSPMKDITLRTSEQLGITIRLKRKEKALSQTALAEILGVERKWVLRLEAGNPTAEMGLVLKALSLLGMRVSLSDNTPLSTRDKTGARNSQLDEVFRRLERIRSK